MYLPAYMIFISACPACPRHASSPDYSNDPIVHGRGLAQLVPRMHVHTVLYM